MDADISGWILDYLLRQNFVDDRLLIDLIRVLPIPDDNPGIKKSLTLREINSDVAKGAISERTLTRIEQIQELDRREGNHEVSQAMRAAYCTVAVHCLEEDSADDKEGECFGALRRISRLRVREKDLFDASLLSDDLLKLIPDLEAGVLDARVCKNVLARLKELDVSEVVRAYVKEELEKMGPSFLELAAEEMSNDAFSKIMNDGDTMEDQNERPSTAEAVEGSDIRDHSPTRPRLPASPKRRPVSPLQLYEFKNLKKQRERKRWTTEEEDTLREGVQKFGRGNWKLILDKYPGRFNDRTEVDLKDKWRNLTC